MRARAFARLRAARSRTPARTLSARFAGRIAAFRLADVPAPVRAGARLVILDTLGAMLNLAGMLYAQGDLAGARQLEEQVLAARRQLLGEKHPDTLTAMLNLALTLSAQGDLA